MSILEKGLSGEPDESTRSYKELILTFLALLDRRWWYTFFSVALILPNSLLLAARLSDKYDNIWLFEKIDKGLAEYPVLLGVAIVSPLLVIILAAVRDSVRDGLRLFESLDHNGLLVLLKCLEKVVAEKATRLSAIVERAQETNGTKSDLFDAITTPEKQYDAIAVAIYFLFSVLYPGKTVEVAIARMGNRHIESFAAWAPKERRPSVNLKDLQKNTCTFSVAYRTRKIVAIRDIAEEGKSPDATRKFERLPNTYPEGSLICVPVLYKDGGTQYPFVISVLVSEKDTFRNTKKQIQKWKEVFQHFESRISLEYSLELLKKSVTEN